MGDFCAIAAGNDWNNALLTGYYRATQNAPDNFEWFGEVIAYNKNRVVQRAYKRHNSNESNPHYWVCAERRVYRDVDTEPMRFSAWEWVNPPMEPGAEYRTTERYLGKPVYVKAVDFGALPNSGDKIVSIEAENSNIVAIRCCGVLNNGVNIPGVDVNDTSTANPIQCWAVSGGIWIAVPYDASHRTAVVTVWYYKTTG